MRKEWRLFLAAALFFLGGFGFGYLGMLVDPHAAIIRLTWTMSNRGRLESMKHSSSLLGISCRNFAASPR